MNIYCSHTIKMNNYKLGIICILTLLKNMEQNVFKNSKIYVLKITGL